MLRQNLSSANQTGLQYDYTNPYAGGSVLTLHNSNSTDVTLSKLNFTVNTRINGDPWGNLWPWGSNLTQIDNHDNTITYTITFPTPGLALKANQTLTLNYPYKDILGTLPIPMDPTRVDAIANNQPTSVTIANSCQDTECKDPTPGKMVASYMANWDIYQRKFFPSDMPIRHTNKWLYAFLNFDVDGTIKLFDPNADQQLLPQISMIRKRFPYLSTSLSIGGWSLSANFSPMTADLIARANFVKNAVAAMKQLGMNGVDIDWEFPVVRDGQPADAKNFASLMTELRQALDAQAKLDSAATGQPIKYLLSIAAPAGIDTIEAIEKEYPNAWMEVFKACDTINVMTYDFHGAFDAISNNQSPLATDPRDPSYANPVSRQYNVKDALAAYVNRGAKPAQLITGVPIYGRAMQVAMQGNTNGLWQQVTGTPPGQFDDSGMYDYRCIIDPAECKPGIPLPADTKIISADENPYANVTQVPLATSPKENILTTFDDARSAQRKAEYVKSNGFGGSMFWLASGDAKDPQHSLIQTTARVYQQGATPALVDSIREPDQQSTFTLAATVLAKPLQRFGERLGRWLPSNQIKPLTAEKTAELQQLQKNFESIKNAYSNNRAQLEYLFGLDNPGLQETAYLIKKTSDLITKKLKTNQSTPADYEMVTRHMQELTARDMRFTALLTTSEWSSKPGAALATTQETLPSSGTPLVVAPPVEPVAAPVPAVLRVGR